MPALGRGLFTKRCLHCVWYGNKHAPGAIRRENYQGSAELHVLCCCCCRVQLTRFVGKVAALLHCSFQEVLLLDADNLPLADPTYLFDDPLYRQRGNLFWPDYWSNWVNDEVYPFLGLERSVVQVRAASPPGTVFSRSLSVLHSPSGLCASTCQCWLSAW